MTDINLRILMQAQSGNVLGTVSNITKALGQGGLSGAMTALGIAAAGAGLAIGALAVDKASAFQNAMLQNVAHAGLAKQQFDAVSKSVLQMSTDVGQMPTDLAQALYPILSGFSGINDQTAKAQTSLEALRLAAMDVTGTTTKTTVASSALVATFNALGLQTNDTATNIARLKNLNDQMETTIIAGNMHWQDYANVAGKLATAIKGTNVQWTEASAALATMTNEGFSAQRSQTYLANLFTQLDLKTDSLAKNAKKLNIHFDEQKFKAMSLTDQLTYLKEITGGNSSEVLKLLNNNATALKTYNALSTNLKAYQTNLEAVTHSHGATATAFQTASSGFDASKNRMKAAIDVLLIDLGTMLLPVLSKLMDWLTPIIKNFANWVLTNKDLHIWLNNIGSFLQYQLVPWMINLWNTASQVVKWFQQGSAPAQALLSLFGGIVALNVAKSIADAAGNVLTFGQNAASFLTGSGKQLLDFFSPTSPEGLAAKATASSALIEADLTTVGGTADTAAGEVALIGSAAEGDALAVTGATATITGAISAVGGIVTDVIGGVTTALMPLAALIYGIEVVFTDPAWNDWWKEHGASKTGPDWITHQHAQTNNTKPSKPGVYGYDPNVQPDAPYGKYYPDPRHFIPQPHRKYASGGVIAEPVIGFGLRSGQGYSFAENGPETVTPGRGGHTFIFNVSTMAGSRAEVIRMVDLMEAEIAARFRGQTPSYGFGGIL